MALDAPPLTPLVLPNPIYDVSELDPRDAFYDLPRGGQKLPGDSLYIYHYSKESGRAKKHTESKWTDDIIIRGLNITIRQYMATDLALKQELLDPTHKMWKLKSLDSPKNKHLLWDVRTRLLERFSYLRPIFDGAYGWWANEAYEAWVCASIRWFKKSPDLTTTTGIARDIKSVHRSLTANRPKSYLEPGPDVAYKLKDCFLRFSLPHNNFKLIPFTAIMTLKAADETDLDSSTTSIDALFTSTNTEFDVCNPHTEIIKYDVNSSIGSIVGEVVENSKDLKKAVLNLYRPSRRVFDMRVESRVEIKEEDEKDCIAIALSARKRQATDCCEGEKTATKRQRTTPFPLKRA